jgi:hypothetical protein
MEGTMMRKAMVVLVLTLAIGAPLAAHHSHVAYDVGRVVELTGTVSDVQWKNPHMLLSVDVPNQSGKVDTWHLEMSGVASTVSAGVTPQVLKVGNKVKIMASPSKDPKKTLGLFLGIEYNGKVYARGGRARNE